MKAPERLETARLLLRSPTYADAASIFQRYASNPDVTRFLGWPRHHSIQDTKAFLAFSEQEWARWPAGPYLILSRADGQLLGSTGLGFVSMREASTGYVLARDAWGRGYATEALTAMLEVARRVGVIRLSALCHPAHRPSQHVLEKCGFARDSPPIRRAEFPNLAQGVQQDALRYVVAPGTTEENAG